MSEKHVTGPLAGIRIVDLTSMLSGPWATMILADQGADVIKVEEPRRRPHPRLRQPPQRVLGLRSSTSTATSARSRIDLKTPRGRRPREAPRARAPTCSCRISAPAWSSGSGVGEEAIRAVAPDIVYVSISGFGEKGPYAQKPVYDPMIQALLRPRHRAGRLGRGAAAAHSHHAARQADRHHGRAGDHRGAAWPRAQDRQGPARAALDAGCGAGVPVGLRHGRADLSSATNGPAARRRASST